MSTCFPHLDPVLEKHVTEQPHIPMVKKLLIPMAKRQPKNEEKSSIDR